MIHLTCPKTGGAVGVSVNHIASVSPDRRVEFQRTVIVLKGSSQPLLVSESSAEVLAAIEAAKPTKEATNAN